MHAHACSAHICKNVSMCIHSIELKHTMYLIKNVPVDIHVQYKYYLERHQQPQSIFYNFSGRFHVTQDFIIYKTVLLYCSNLL